MTDLEREAAEIVSDIVTGTLTTEGGGFAERERVARDRIVALVQKHAREREQMPEVGGREWAMQDAAAIARARMPQEYRFYHPRATELL